MHKDVCNYDEHVVILLGYVEVRIHPDSAGVMGLSKMVIGFWVPSDKNLSISQQVADLLPIEERL